MQGYQLTFFTQQDRMHQRKPLAQWIVEEARSMGLRGATMLSAAEGYGRDKKVRSAGFFELSAQPLQVVLVVSEEEAQRMLDRLKQENLNLFYVKTPVEFGMTAE